jgi:hypothetical protein
VNELSLDRSALDQELAEARGQPGAHVGIEFGVPLLRRRARRVEGKHVEAQLGQALGAISQSWLTHNATRLVSLPIYPLQCDLSSKELRLVCQAGTGFDG